MLDLPRLRELEALSSPRVLHVRQTRALTREDTGATGRLQPRPCRSAHLNLGVTAAFVAALGTIGYATRRDLSSCYRVFFWALLALIVVGIVAIFVSIPQVSVIWSVAGLMIFAGFTVIDFNRLRRAGADSAVPIAAGIFLAVLNVFLLLLNLFGGEH